MKDLVANCFDAAKADRIPEGDSGLWSIRKFAIAKPLTVDRDKGRSETIPPGHYTNLFCMTEASMHTHGELVMHDCPAELKKHAQFFLSAFGKVLITGLGLGCVARATLANPRVSAVTVVEKSQDVLNLVQPWMPKDPRLTIVHADALHWIKTTEPFDCAWHDLWVPDDSKPHLQVIHAELIGNLFERVTMQGAWEFPRYFRRSWKFAKLI